MKQKLIIVLCAMALLLVVGTAGMYASSLLKSRAAKEAGVETTTQDVAAAPDSTIPAPIRPRTTTPDTTTGAKPPAKTSSGATTPRAGTAPAPLPNAGSGEPPSRPPFAGRGQGGPRDPAAFEKMRGKFELMGLFGSLGRLDELKAPLTSKQAKAILAIMDPLRKQATLSPEEADKALAKLRAELTKKQVDALARAAEERRKEREQMVRDRQGGDRGGRQPGGAPGTDDTPRRRGGGDMGADPGGAPGGGDPGWAPGGGGPGGAPGGGGPGGVPGGGGPGGVPGGGGPGGGGPGGGGRGPGGFGAKMETMNPFHPGDNPMSQRMAERNNAVFAALEAKAAGK